MIYDSIQNLNLYRNLHPLFGKGFDFVLHFDAKKENGRHSISDNDIYANVFAYETAPREKQKFEAHNKYIDVHFLLEGQELMDVAIDAKYTVCQPYSDDTDSILYSSADQFCSIKMDKGHFAILYPDDVHRPGCEYGSGSHVRKLVLKVRI